MDLKKKMEQEFRDIVKYFGENEQKINTEDFFSIFAAFLMNFEVRVVRKWVDELLKRLFFCCCGCFLVVYLLFRKSNL